MGKYECDICGYTLTHNQEFHGKCPRCGASAFERHTTRKTKMKQNHVKWPEKIYVPPCPDTIDEKALGEALDKIFKKKRSSTKW